MDFVKGAMMGIIAGTVVGVMNSGNLKSAFYKGKRQIKRMKRRYA